MERVMGRPDVVFIGEEENSAPKPTDDLESCGVWARSKERGDTDLRGEKRGMVRRRKQRFSGAQEIPDQSW